MHRERGGGYRERGPPLGKDDFHRYENSRYDGRDRGKRYDRPRSRSRSPRRYRSRTRSRSRERYRDSHYKDKRSMSPPRKDRGIPDSEGLRITIQSRKEQGYYDDRDRRRRCRSSEKYSNRVKRGKRRSSSSSSSSSSRYSSKSRSILNSPHQGRSKDPSRPGSVTSLEESLRITVGNDRYLQKPSAVERLGPPVGHENGRMHQYGQEVVSRSDNYPYLARDKRTHELLSQRAGHGGHSSRYSDEMPNDRLRPDVQTHGHIVPFPGKTPNEEDLYASKLRHRNVPCGISPTSATPAKEPPLPLLPGLCQILNIDDEDKFLYGDDDDKPKIEPERNKPLPVPEPVALCKLASAYNESEGSEPNPINQYGDLDYRMRSNQQRQFSKERGGLYGRDSYPEPCSERELYRDSAPRNEPYEARDEPHAAPAIQYKKKENCYMREDRQDTLGSEHYPLITRDDIRHPGSQEPYAQRHEQCVPSNDHNGEAKMYSDPSNNYRRSSVIEHQSEVSEPPEEKKNVDPTLQNILKSIGFNFELSKLMQEKAQKEREKRQKNELEYTVKKGGSFMNGGLKNMDLKSVFDVKHNFEEEARRREAKLRCLDEEKRGAKRSIIATPETYEQMAKKYIEEQARAYKVEHKLKSEEKLHPRDYLTENHDYTSRKSLEKGYEEYDVFDRKGSYDTVHGKSFQKTQYTSRDYDAGYKDITGKDYMEKLFEDDSGHDRRDDPRCEGSIQKYEEPGQVQFYEQESRCEEPGRDRRHDYHEERSSYVARSESRSELYNNTEDTQKRRPPHLYGSRTANHKKHSSSRSPRDQSSEKDEYPESRRTKRKVSPPRELAKDDLRNVLIASDKGSRRTVLPPKADKERVKEVQSPRQEEVVEKRVISVLSPKEREQLEKEKEERKKRLVILENELDKLRKQQGEMMRKKQRQKDGHKDPLLVENSKLQDEITKQITVLRKAVENQISEEGKGQVAGVKFKMEKIPKVVKAQAVLVDSSSESEGESKTVKRDKAQSERKTTSSVKSPKPVTRQKEDKSKSKEETSSPSSLSTKEKDEKDEKKYEKADKTQSKAKPKFHVNYEFFDSGNHWCRKCNVVSSNVYEVFQHLQKKQHISKMDSHDRPWMPESLVNPKTKSKKGQTVAVPIQGVEFMMSTQAFYCRLCKVFAGDASCAEYHLKSEEHYKMYQGYVNENPFYEQRFNLDKAAGVSLAACDGDDKKKHDVTQDKQYERKSDSGGKDDEVSAAERVKQQKRAIERQLREKEEEDERKRKEWEDQVKKSAEAERERQNKEAKENVEKARLELPATGKIGKMTWVKQQQRIQEKIKQRQEEAKEREAVQQKGRLQFSFGRAAPTFQTANNNQMGQQGPRIDAATFMKKLKEEKERNQIKDQAAEPATLDQFLSVGNDSLPVVTETIPLPKALQVESAPKFVSTEVSPSLPKSDVQKEREEDLKMLGIDPDSTSVMDISNRPPVMAARKPNTVATSPGASGAATSASSLYSVFNPSTSHTEPAPPVVSSVTSTSTSSSDGWISSFAQSKPTGQETIALSDIPVPAPDRDTHQVDDMDLGSEGSVSMGDFEVLDEVA